MRPGAVVAERSGKVVVNRVLAPKSHELLADQLRAAIAAGQLPAGSVLPSERRLVEQTELTRGSVRGALKLLAAEGLVTTRQGRLGGYIVTLPRQEQDQ